MQITESNPSHYTSNCILLREKLLLKQSGHGPHFDHQLLWLRPLESTLYSGQPATLCSLIDPFTKRHIYWSIVADYQSMKYCIVAKIP